MEHTKYGLQKQQQKHELQKQHELQNEQQQQHELQKQDNESHGQKEQNTQKEAIQRMIQKRFGGNINGGRGITQNTPSRKSGIESYIKDKSNEKVKTNDKIKDTLPEKNKRTEHLKNQENFGERKRIKP